MTEKSNTDVNHENRINNAFNETLARYEKRWGINQGDSAVTETDAQKEKIKELQNDKELLVNALGGLVGTDNKDALKIMLNMVNDSNAPSMNKNPMICAIKTLLAVLK